jgi:hypothetical protein
MSPAVTIVAFVCLILILFVSLYLWVSYQTTKKIPMLSPGPAPLFLSPAPRREMFDVYENFAQLNLTNTNQVRKLRTDDATESQKFLPLVRNPTPQNKPTRDAIVTKLKTIRDGIKAILTEPEKTTYNKLINDITAAEKNLNTGTKSVFEGGRTIVKPLTDADKSGFINTITKNQTEIDKLLGGVYFKAAPAPAPKAPAPAPRAPAPKAPAPAPRAPAPAP